MSDIAEKLAEAQLGHVVLEKLTTVNGTPVTMFSHDGQNWFSRKGDIARWQAARAKLLRDHRDAFNPKISKGPARFKKQEA